MTLSVVVGFFIALVQASVCTAALRWSWKKKSFYWVWGGGILFRFLVFGLTAYHVYRNTNLNLVATLISLVVTTTLLLVLESKVFLHGLSSSSRTSST